ncbi:cytochrome C [Gordoniibacillus kamchatkensis]|uniref:Cytochrome C n=1 Tax=Gordoniibacillus kamchatkensis TaxID=1590651 RepID=A0ABR5AG42_9BACL|nr:DeoR/GlpR family DNA-binding transcription regulator [Paenibacillus sp. VKM B-2647]KIL39994.1 cytochrome C [Paenibacillus sp. VKM B-2647]
MLAEERRQHILQLLEKERRVIAKDLAELFHISIDSVRRDLTIMEDQGLLQKTYGGAIPAAAHPKVRNFPLPQALRYGDGAPHQNAISKLAATYIQKNDTVFIGGAGIHYGMLKYLPHDMPFTVVTNSLKIAESIRERVNVEAYLIGGKLRPSSGNMIDSIALEMIGKFTLDVSFITGGGISASGISTATPEGAAFTRALAESSRKKIGLAPHEKLGLKMFAMSIPIEQLDLLITDRESPEKIVRDIESRKVKVIVAGEEEPIGGNQHEVD